jgi:hypothetical protein
VRAEAKQANSTMIAVRQHIRLASQLDRSTPVFLRYGFRSQDFLEFKGYFLWTRRCGADILADFKAAADVGHSAAASTCSTVMPCDFVTKPLGFHKFPTTTPVLETTTVSPRDAL